MSPSEWRQFTLLSRDSLRKLLNAVVLSRDGDPTQFAIWMTAIVSTPPSLYAFSQMFKYTMMRQQTAAVVEAVVLQDRMFFVFYSMVAAGLLAALTWEALFPDRTDQEVIGSLPVRPRTLAAARLSAALVMVTIFSAAINLPSALFFSFVSVTHPLLGFLPTVFLAHIVSTMAGCLAMFMALLILRGVVALVAGAAVADQLATVLQLVAVVSVIEVFFYLPSVLPLLVRRMLEGSDAVTWMPPAWYVALYSSIVGTTRTVLRGEAITGLLVFLAAVVAVVPAYLLPARLMARRALESQARDRQGRVGTLLRLAGRLAPAGPSRAISEFAITTLFRSRRHLLIVVSYAGAGLAIAAVSVIAARIRVGLLSAEVNTALLAVPLVMMFFLTFGLRAAFRVPSDLDANWPFRLCQPTVAAAGTGTRHALFVLAVIPSILLFVSVGLVGGWTPGTAATIAVFDLAMGALLLEFALYGWTLVPFASAHATDQETMKSRWLWYVVLLNIFAFRGASAQVGALTSVRASLIYLAIVIAVALVIRVARLQRTGRDAIAFDAPQEFRLETLNLSEAAQ